MKVTEAVRHTLYTESCPRIFGDLFYVVFHLHRSKYNWLDLVRHGNMCIMLTLEHLNVT